MQPITCQSRCRFRALGLLGFESSVFADSERGNLKLKISHSLDENLLASTPEKNGFFSVRSLVCSCY